MIYNVHSIVTKIKVNRLDLIGLQKSCEAKPKQIGLLLENFSISGSLRTRSSKICG